MRIRTIAAALVIVCTACGHHGCTGGRVRHHAKAPPPDPADDAPVLHPPPVLPAPPADARRGIPPHTLVVGEAHACATLADHTVACWGDDTHGQLGDGDAVHQGDGAVRAKGLHDVVQLAAGDDHTCALSKDGRVYCWGDDAHGQLGLGKTGDQSATPKRVPHLTGVVEIAAGWLHTCARLSSGQVACWGVAWQVGAPGVDGDVSHPVMVPDIHDARSLSAGWKSTCVARASGQVVCWGALGDPYAVTNPIVPGIRHAVTVAVGLAPETHGAGDCDPQCWEGEVQIPSACAIAHDGHVSCWRRLPRPRHGPAPPVHPTRVDDVTNARSLALSSQTRCALDTQGAVHCWGKTDRVPSALSPVDELVFRNGHGCVRRGSAVSCWGNGSHGVAGPPADLAPQAIALPGAP